MRDIRWLRILVGGVLTEAAIFAVFLPLNARNPQIAYYSVPLLVAGTAVLFGWLVARPLRSRFVLHAALTAATASIIYLLLNVASGTLALVPWLYHVANVLRPLAGAAGGALARRGAKVADPATV